MTVATLFKFLIKGLDQSTTLKINPDLIEWKKCRNRLYIRYNIYIQLESNYLINKKPTNVKRDIDLI